MANISRRNFLTAISSGLLGLGLTTKGETVLHQEGMEKGESFPPKIQKYNPLGNTGLKVSDVSCGAISLFEPNVLRYAFDCGVNYFDTAESYLRTKSETFIGQALKHVRDKVIITTKHAYSSREKVKKADIIRRVEASLKRMQTDYVDVAMIHQCNDLSLLQNEDIPIAYSQLKKEGKVRFTGFSTHNPKLTLQQALQSDFARVILLIYNHMEGKDIEPLIEKVRKKGIGVVAMKVFAGGKQGNLKSLVSREVSYPQAAIRWVLSNPHIDCLIATMSSYSHVEEYVAASAKPLSKADLLMIAEYRQQTQREYCRISCSDCLAVCPSGVAINEVLRYKMYFEDYRMEKEATRYYAELEEEKKPLSCARCQGLCDSACPYGLRVKEKLIHAHEVLSA
ncbi:MAG: aldo/keto reductase [Candidatus Aminicenantales bacterium]